MLLSAFESDYLNIIIYSLPNIYGKIVYFNLPNLTVILRRNIPFKIPPAEVELTSASKFEEYILTILKKLWEM